MMDRRSYDQYCGLAKALDVVGERWTLLIVRNLLLGSQRYSELLRALPGITTNLLAKRLQDMEELGLLERVGGESSGQAYRLTTLGLALEPAVHALSRWGWKTMGPPKKEFRSFDFLMVALRRRYRGGTALRGEIVADGVPYRVILSEARAEIARGEVDRPDVVIRGPGSALIRLFLEESARKKWPSEIEIEGRAADAKALIGAFRSKDVDEAA
jgi:DNA-binding HxlR family transcriptional regulator